MKKFIFLLLLALALDFGGLAGSSYSMQRQIPGKSDQSITVGNPNTAGILMRDARGGGGGGGRGRR